MGLGSLNPRLFRAWLGLLGLGFMTHGFGLGLVFKVPVGSWIDRNKSIAGAF